MKLAHEAMRLHAFYEEVGRAMFDAGWSGGGIPPREPPVRLGLSSATEKSLQVVEQLALGFASGELTAALVLSLPASSDDPFDDGSGVRPYPLGSSAWEDYWPSRVTDWPTSQMRVDVRQVFVSDSRPGDSSSRLLGPLQDVRRDLSYPADEMVEGPVLVLRADHALRALLPLSRIPQSAESLRYLAFRNRLIDELVAAAWRALALNVPSSADVRPKLLIEYMRDYMSAQDIDGDANRLSDNLLQALAAKLVRQWNERNLASRVLLNSTPVKPPKTYLYGRGRS